MTAEVDEYLAGVPEPARATLEALRAQIRALLPEATEAISYRIPTFKLGRKPVVGYGASKEHCSLYLMGYLPPELEVDLKAYDTGKGTVRFPPDDPLPADLVRKVVQARLAEVRGT